MAERVTVYGADWCGDTRRTLRHLEQSGVKFDYIDVDQDKAGEEKVIQFSKGKRRIPLVEIASEGGQTKSIAVPSASDLDSALS
jgi:glutaredoxin